MRESGILMPVSSLPGPYGIGCFGKEAFKFVDFLAQAGQKIWQILPLSPTGYGDSPYQSCSAFAGNPYFIDLDALKEEGLLTAAKLKAENFRFWDEFPEYCTLPHIMAFIMTASTKQLSIFLQQNLVAEMMAGAYLKAEGSEKTQASYLSTLCNNLATISQNEEIAYVLSGDDFDFNLIDPENPKLFAVSNNFSKNSVYAPVIGMLMSISTRQFTMQNKVPFVYFLDEMTTVNIKNFESLPSVLREYKVAFVLLTQSGSKLENLYGKLDRSSVEANFGIQFFGRTKDVEALKYYPQMFGKEEKERKSRSTGKSGSSSNRSVTISSQKEDIYQGRDFADLEPGEFIGSATRANVRYFKVMLGEFKEKDEKPLPDVRVLEPGEISGNFARILEEVRSLFPCE